MKLKKPLKILLVYFGISKNHSLITQIDYKGKHVSSNHGMANAFNDFTNVGPKLDELIPTNNSNRNPKYYLKTQIPHSFLLSLTDIINNLKVSKSTGTCPIPTNLLKVAVPFSDICNSSFEEYIFPDKNKIAKVIPSHKNGSTKDVNNYRHISLLSMFSKITEKLVAIRLNTYLDLHNIIYPEQFGFRAGFSTTHSFIRITETIKKTIEENNYGCGV